MKTLTRLSDLEMENIVGGRVAPQPRRPLLRLIVAILRIILGRAGTPATQL